MKNNNFKVETQEIEIVLKCLSSKIFVKKIQCKKFRNIPHTCRKISVYD